MAEPRRLLPSSRRGEGRGAGVAGPAAAGAGRPAQALQVVDDRGVAVNLPRPPQRIVTMLPSLGETVCELGACDRLVGVDNYANWPPSVQRLPRVGGVEDPNIERIVALKPDLVLLSATSRAIARLQSSGHAGVRRRTQDAGRCAAEPVHKVAQVLGVPGADAAWAAHRRRASTTRRARLPPSARAAPRCTSRSASGPYAASESSHIGELLSRLGAANIVPARLGSVPKLNPEFVVRADPQVIMMRGRRCAAAGASGPGWSRDSRGARRPRLRASVREQSDVIVRPGPRLAEAAAILAHCLQQASARSHSRERASALHAPAPLALLLLAASRRAVRGRRRRGQPGWEPLWGARR